MNQVIAVIYQPGAYGSFVSWLTERTSKVRRRFEPAIMDNPLLPDGSSHAYASFCKIKDGDDFMAGLNEARWDIRPWHSVIYAGWPAARHQQITPVVQRILDWMLAFDRIIYVSCDRDDDHYLRYLRNETTMDQVRWYGMLGITDPADLKAQLIADCNAEPLLIDDPRMVRVTMQDLLFMDRERFTRSFTERLGWPICDRELAEDVLVNMRAAQTTERLRLQHAKAGDSSSAAMRAVRDAYLERRGKKHGSD